MEFDIAEFSEEINFKACQFLLDRTTLATILYEDQVVFLCVSDDKCVLMQSAGFPAVHMYSLYHSRTHKQGK
jgi:hypothetical protein